MKLKRARQRWLGPSGWALGAVLAGCVSNPTPHPAADARGDDARNDTPTDQAGCEYVGGFWDGATCFEAGETDGETFAPEPDAEVIGGDGEVDAPDGEVDVDAPDGEVGEVGDDVGPDDPGP